MLAESFPSEPSAAWTFHPTAASNGTASQVATPVFGAAFYGSPGAVVVGDHVIFHTVGKSQSSQAENAELVSVSLADGHTEWSMPVQLNDGCARNLLRNLLVCQKSGTNSRQGQLQFVDVNTGKVSATVSSRASILASDGTSLYTAYYSDQVSGLTVSKGTAEDPTAEWTKTIPNDLCRTYGDGDGQDLHVSHGVLWGYLGGAEIALRSSDGSPLFDHEVVNVRVREPDSIIATRCRPGTDFDSWPTEVATFDGRQLFTTPALLQHEDLAVFTGSPPLITTGGEALNPRTGSTLWRLPDGGATGPGWFVGSIGVVSDGDGMTAYDMNDGNRLWRNSGTIHSNAVTDGERAIIATGYSAIAAISLANGSRAWEVGIDVGEAAVIYATSKGVLAVGTSGVTLLRPTGPAAAVPAFGTPPPGKSGGTRLTTKCGRPAHFEPQAIRAESGALVITMKIVAQCPGGDVLSSARTRLAVTSDGQNVASGTFDLAEQPLIIPPATSSDDNPSITHDFLFPAGTFWRIPVSLNAIPAGGASQTGPTDLGVTTLTVDCQQDGPSGTTGSKSNSASQSSTATGPAAPASGTDESASFDALRALANADRPFVTTNLTDRWVPQLSSKRPGLVADGITWDNAATLREHLDLRLRYPEVRLLYSGDWSTFSAPDFWVTIAGVTFADSDSALGWCRDHGLDREHCYAKLVSTSHPVDGSTAFNP
ncbi:PQQ-binding-like beta-propeller repeat protein [Mycolicibacterium sp. ELW1]|uniref:outer membrane protein assembly factor BamB family protein n=1 Tax=Mycobacteriaceae TaxID=1762 RepID=UPI00143D87AB|nr:PQQ-binding-like beta-propeller repeat protein [Mycobacterium sp. ELW1]